MAVFEWDSCFQKIVVFPLKTEDYVHSRGKTTLMVKDAKRQFWTEMLKKEKFIVVTACEIQQVIECCKTILWEKGIIALGR